VPALPSALATPARFGIPVCSSSRAGSLVPAASLVRTASRLRTASGHCRPDTSRCTTSPRMTVPGRIKAGPMTRRGAEPSGFPALQPMTGLPARPRMPATARIPAGPPTTTTAPWAVMTAAGSTRTDIRPGAGFSRVSVTMTRSRTTTSGPMADGPMADGPMADGPMADGPAMAAARRGAGGRAAPAVPGGVGSDGSRPWSRCWLFSSR